MSAVTGLRRFPILAIAALVAAGCGATPAATSVPSPSSLETLPTASASPSPIATAPPAQEPEETDEPETTPEPNSTTCPVDAPTTQPSVRLSSDLSQAQPVVEITRIARVSAPATELPLPEIDRPAGDVRLVGGRRAIFGLFYIDYDWPFGWMITDFTAKLSIGNRDPIPLDVDIGPDSMGNVSSASVRIPDRDATGVVNVSLKWYDSCFVYDGTVSTPVRIYPESSVAGCPTGRVAAFDELSIAFEPPIRIGETEVRLLPWRFAGKVRDLSVVDPLPPYVGFNAESPTVTASPGGTITAAHSNPAVELTLMDMPRVTFFERVPLLRWLDDGWIYGFEPAAPIVFRSKLVRNSDGTFSFEAPPDAGRYAAEAVFDYDSACTLGTAGFVVGVDVE